MDEMHGLRDKYDADVAVLIVDDPKGCGLAIRVYADAPTRPSLWSITSARP